MMSSSSSLDIVPCIVLDVGERSASTFPYGASLALTVVTHLFWSGAHRVTASAKLA